MKKREWMKRTGGMILLTGVMAMVIGGCGADANTVSSQAASAASQVVEAVQNIDASALYETVKDSVKLPDMVSIDPAFNYGVSTDLCTSYVFYRATEVTKADTVAFFVVKDSADVAQIKEELETAKAFDIQSADGYNPETYELFSASEIKSVGNLVFWIVSEDAANIEKMISSFGK